MKHWKTYVVIGAVVIVIAFAAGDTVQFPALSALDPAVGTGTVIPQTGIDSPGVYGESPGFFSTAYNNLLSEFESVGDAASSDLRALVDAVSGSGRVF